MGLAGFASDAEAASVAAVAAAQWDRITELAREASL